MSLLAASGGGPRGAPSEARRRGRGRSRGGPPHGFGGPQGAPLSPGLGGPPGDHHGSGRGRGGGPRNRGRTALQQYRPSQQQQQQQQQQETVSIDASRVFVEAAIAAGATTVSSQQQQQQQQFAVIECVVCCEETPCVAVGCCSHFSCWLCALRLRLGPRKLRQCPFCFSSSPLLLLLFTGESPSRVSLEETPAALLQPPVYAAAAIAKLPPQLVSPAAGLAFASAAVRRYNEAVLQLRCWMSPCRDTWLFSYVFAPDLHQQQQDMIAAAAAAAEAEQRAAAATAARAHEGITDNNNNSSSSSSSDEAFLPFTGPPDEPSVFGSLTQLSVHLSKQHMLQLCRICLLGRSEQLLVQQQLLSPPLYRLHMQQQQQQQRWSRGADSAAATAAAAAAAGVAVHPKCIVCGERTIDGYTLLLHFRDTHFSCPLCEQDYHRAAAAAAADGAGAPPSAEVVPVSCCCCGCCCCDCCCCCCCCCLWAWCLAAHASCCCC